MFSVVQLDVCVVTLWRSLRTWLFMCFSRDLSWVSLPPVVCSLVVPSFDFLVFAAVGLVVLLFF